MEIKIHSFGNPESLDLRCILEGMYRKAGRVMDVSFPNSHTIRIRLEEQFNYENEFGIHRMIRMSPRDEDMKPRSSHVMVEINGKSRDSVVCTYTFFPQSFVENHLTGKSTRDLMYVLGGHPLGMKIDENALMYEMV